MSQWYARCNLMSQDCASLYPRRTNTAFSDRSCIQDIRIGENIGRCGWAGAPCVVNGSYSNCAKPRAEVCRGGFCTGAPGDPCTSDSGCNSGIYCNVSSGTGGVCGGAGAVVYNAAIDFGRDYCASGSAVQNVTSIYGWSCAPGPFLVFPSPIPAPPPNSTPSANPSTTPSPSSPSANGPRPSTPSGAIISGLVVFSLVAALLLRRRRQRSKNSNDNAPGTDALHHL